MDTLKNLFESNHVPRAGEKLEILDQYIDLIVQNNRKYGLTGDGSRQTVINRLVHDSCYPLIAHCKINGKNSPPVSILPQKVVDIGTGAGIPGLCFKILFPGSNVLLVDSSLKKCDFLRLAVRKMGLLDVKAVHARAEELGRQSRLREQFDVVMARFVGDLDMLAEYGLCFLQIGGKMLAYKGEDADRQAARAAGAIRANGGRVENIRKYPARVSGRTLGLVEIIKISSTPAKYPRRPGAIQKRPIR